MFCPKCAGQNLDGASYCRVCGANISLVPQALSGQLPGAPEEGLSRREARSRRRYGKEVGLDGAFRNAFMGLAFLFIAIALSFSGGGHGWWFWMLIPAFSMMGTGVAQYIRVKEHEKRTMLAGGLVQPPIQASPVVNTFPARGTGEIVSSPPSVTEGTTRHLGAEGPTRHFDSATEPRK